MAEAFFQNFPRVNYENVSTRNIILKAGFFADVLKNFSAFYPYTVKDDDRADLVAHHYYGDWRYDWLVYFSNNIVDPYYGWPLTQADFEAYLLKKYGSFEYALDTIHHYTYNDQVEEDDIQEFYRSKYTLTPETYSFMSVQDKSFWKPVYLYEFEFQKNEEKRDIKLLDDRLLPQVEREISNIFGR